MQSRFILAVAANLMAGCAPERPAPGLRLRGPLAALADPAPASLDACEVAHREYSRPFWRAPYRECRDSSAAGRQFLEVDADSVVTEATRIWVVPSEGARAAWEREAGRLTRTFGAPARTRLAPPPAESGRELDWSRSYCAAWQGSDSVQAALILRSTTDANPDDARVPWHLVRAVRNGPLADAVACGLARG